MKTTTTLCAALLLLAVGCGHSGDTAREQAKSAIAQQELTMSASELGAASDVADRTVAMYRQFVADYPDDSLAPIYMMRAADVLTNVERPAEAVQLLDSILSLYPGFEDLGGCLFLKGYAYEQMEAFDSARAAYTQFVDQYPDHYLAPDTRSMLPYLGVSPEQMLAAIMENANDKNLVQD